MPILDEIEAFFAVQPNWRRQIYNALVSNADLTEQLLAELTEECINNAGSPETSAAATVLGKAAQKDESEPTPIVRLRGIQSVQNVAKLAPGQSLSFAPDGLTIIYGDNGAGKTGYERILRQVCRARGPSPVLRGNVFADAQPRVSAQIIFSVNGNDAQLSIPSAPTGDNPLRHISIFDTGAAASLVNEQNATAFRPFGLDLLDRFSAVADEVQRRIERELAQLSSPYVRAAEFPESTKAGQVIRQLHLPETRNSLETHLSPLTDSQEKRRNELERILAQAKVDDPAKAAVAVSARASRYQQFQRRIDGIAASLHSSKVQAFVELRSRVNEVRAAAELARSKAFSDEPLPDVGSTTWRHLWDAARQYAAVTGHGDGFAAVEPGDRCPLCAQQLDEAAATRMRTLEAFVTEELQQTVKTLSKQHAAMLDGFNAQPLQQPGDEALLEELSADDANVAAQAKEFLARARAVTRMLQVHFAAGEGDLAAMSVPTAPREIAAISSALLRRAMELQKSAMASTLAAQQSELAELDARKRLVDIATQVRNEASRLSRVEELERAKKSTSTRAVSELSRELTMKYVSDALCNRFRSELANLGLDHLESDLKCAGAHKGQLFHQITLKAKHDAPLREVVSEGEFRCLALAAFLAEVGGTTSGILFDDPVSSLDHGWRGRIAVRLANEARKRQVIVFTHDIAFHFLLREAAESPAVGVAVTEGCIERRGKASAGFCRDHPPWAGMKTKTRVGMLRNDLVRLKKEYEAGAPTYERDIRDWFGRLRETWERAVEECLLKDAVRRFSHSVKTNSLKDALRKIRPEEDWAAIERGMTRSSAAIRGHDGAAELNPPVPTPTDAEQDLAELEAWVKTKN